MVSWILQTNDQLYDIELFNFPKIEIRMEIEISLILNDAFNYYLILKWKRRRQ